jgi:hypothetical protein
VLVEPLEYDFEGLLEITRCGVLYFSAALFGCSKVGKFAFFWILGCVFLDALFKNLVLTVFLFDFLALC